MTPPRFAHAVALALLTLALGCSSGNHGVGGVSLAPVVAQPAAALQPPPRPPAGQFSTVIDNPYFPLVPGTMFHYRATTLDGVATDDYEVTGDTKVVDTVTTRVVHDQVRLNGSLIEDTLEWFAQDQAGNVWYFGEDSKEISNGQVVSTEGSWQAGVNGALAGIQMLAHPKSGQGYAQEFAPGVAVDQARVSGQDKSVTVPYGTFDDCLETTEWTAIDRQDRGTKDYAPGVGMVLDVDTHSAKVRSELVGIDKP